MRYVVAGVMVAMVSGCGSGASTTVDASDACAQTATITGSVGGHAFGAVSSATIERFSDTEYVHTSVAISDGSVHLTMSAWDIGSMTAFDAGSGAVYGTSTFSYTAITPTCARGTFHAEIQGGVLDGTFTAASTCTHPTCAPL